MVLTFKTSIGSFQFATITRSPIENEVSKSTPTIKKVSPLIKVFKSFLLKESTE